MVSNTRNPKPVSEFEAIVAEQYSLLKPIEKCWQPTDVLPDLTDSNWQDQVDELRNEAKRLPSELLVALVGNTITEEALPTYQTWLNRFPEMRDETGVAMNPWAVWTRAWTAEENRHGDALNRYMYLCGRIDMRSFEVTTQHLLSRGFDPKAGEDPYMALVYVSFQEKATRIAHSNVARLAGENGDATLSKICRLIAADEARHEEAYKQIFSKLMEIYPKRSVVAFYKMMKQRIAMPAHLMSDGIHDDLYLKFATIAQRVGVYTAHDYVDVIRHLVSLWKVESIPNLTGEEAMAQEYLCRLADRYAKKADMIQQMAEENPPATCQWLFEGAVA